jgi:UPF0755 protein
VKKSGLYSSLFLIFVVLIISLIQIKYITSSQKVDEIFIKIPKKTNADEIAYLLFEHNIIKSPLYFRIYVKYHHFEKKLSYGNYLFDGELNLEKVVNILVNAKIKLNKVTIPEGLTVWKTAKLLSQKGFVDYQKFIFWANDPDFAKLMTGFKLKSLEGFLYPETYFLPDGVSEKYIIKAMVGQFFHQTKKLNFNEENGLNFYQTIILASIVEREAKISSEKPKIASVYLNRLAINQKLQADPTIAYFLDLRGINRKKIYYKDLEINSPYNTYKFKGLPPTPICNPSITSIKAVLNPMNTTYYYFFADGHGHHIFSDTYYQHLTRQRIMKFNKHRRSKKS